MEQVLIDPAHRQVWRLLVEPQGRALTRAGFRSRTTVKLPVSRRIHSEEKTGLRIDDADKSAPERFARPDGCHYDKASQYNNQGNAEPLQVAASATVPLDGNLF